MASLPSITQIDRPCSQETISDPVHLEVVGDRMFDPRQFGSQEILGSAVG